MCTTLGIARVSWDQATNHRAHGYGKIMFAYRVSVTGRVLRIRNTSLRRTMKFPESTFPADGEGWQTGYTRARCADIRSASESESMVVIIISPLGGTLIQVVRPWWDLICCELGHDDRQKGVFVES